MQCSSCWSLASGNDGSSDAFSRHQHDALDDVPQELARVGEVDGGLEGQLPRLADVVQKGGGEQQVPVHPAVLLGHEVARLGHADRVLHQPAQVGVMVDLGGRRRGEGLEEGRVAEDELEQGGVVPVVDRTDVELQEAPELLDVAVGGGEEVARLGGAGGRRAHLGGLQLGLALVLGDPGADRDQVPHLDVPRTSRRPPTPCSRPSRCGRPPGACRRACPAGSGGSPWRTAGRCRPLRCPAPGRTTAYASRRGDAPSRRRLQGLEGSAEIELIVVHGPLLRLLEPHSS